MPQIRRTYTFPIHFPYYPDMFPILSAYCSDTVSILFPYSLHTVVILFSYGNHTEMIRKPYGSHTEIVCFLACYIGKIYNIMEIFSPEVQFDRNNKRTQV